MSIDESILRGERRIAHYEAIEYAWRIGKKAKSIKAYRSALHVMLWKIRDSGKLDHEDFDFKDLLEELPIIPDRILEALNS